MEKRQKKKLLRISELTQEATDETLRRTRLNTALVGDETLKTTVTNLGLSLAASKAQIEHVYNEMVQINVNRNPLKWQIKAQWEQWLKRAMDQMDKALIEVPTLYDEASNG